MTGPPVGDVDVDALVARLRAELDPPGNEKEPSGVPSWHAARVEANRLAAVSGDRPFFRRSGALGRLRSYATMPAKTVVRKLVRWYVEPIAGEQRAFNAAVLRLVDDLAAWTAADVSRREGELRRAHEHLSERVDELDRGLRAQVEESVRRLSDLEDRLLRVERRPAAPPAAAPAAGRQPAAAEERPVQPLFDYFAFEGRMRQGRDEIRRRQAHYVDEFRESAPVLDVGCGRGEFLELLREAGIESRGIDLDEDMVAFCRGEGLDVTLADALTHLDGLEDGSLGGIFCAHVVEHLRPAQLVRFLELAAAKVRVGGVLIAETPNPRTLVALQTFFADLTHEQPLHPETLAFLVRQAGFGEEELRFLNPPPEDAQLQPVPLPEGEQWEPARRVLAENVIRLNQVIFGPQDYAVVARR